MGDVDIEIQVDDTQTQKLKLAGNVAQTASATMVTAFNQAAAAFSRVGGMISNFTSGAVSSFASFDQAMMNTQSIAVGTAEEFDEMRKLAGKMASEMPFYSSEIADGYYYLACLKPDELILCNHEIKRIIDVKDDDRVIGSNGLPQKILKRTRRPCTEKTILNIKPRCNLNFGVTPNHPILAMKVKRCLRHGKRDFCKPNKYCAKEFNCSKKFYKNYILDWIRSENLEIGDALVLPKIKIEEDIKLEWSHVNTSAKNKKLPSVLDNDFAKFLGLVLGDGWSASDGERIGLALSDSETVDWAKKYLESLGYHITIREMQNCKQITVCSRALNAFIAKHLGRGASNKRIPMFMFRAKRNIIKNFLYGYFLSDGCKFKQGRQPKVSFTTRSRNIAQFINLLVGKCGYYFYVNEYDGRKYTSYINGRKIQAKGMQYNISSCNPKFYEFITGEKSNYIEKRNRVWQDENYIYFPITSIKKEDYDGFVYNLETEDNTYLTSVIVHNSAGFDANQILELTEPILKAATAAGTDFTTAANTLTSTLLVFEPVGYDINRIMDIMQNTVRLGKTTFDELGLTMAYVSSAGASAGVSLEDLGASIDIVRGAGLDASMAGTSLRMMLMKLADITPEAQKLMDEFGLSIVYTEDGMFDYIGTLKLFNTQLKGVPPGLERLNLLQTVFGTRAAMAADALIKNTDRLEELSVEMEHAGSVTEAYDVQIMGLANQLKLLDGEVDEATKKLGEALAPAEIWCKERTVDLYNALAGLPEPLLTIGGGIVLVTGNIMNALSPMMSMASSFMSLIMLRNIAAASAGAHGGATIFETISTKAATIAQWLFNTSLYACPIVWIMLAIIALIAVIYLLIKHWDTIRDAVVKFGEAVYDFVKPAIDVIIDGLTWLWEKVLSPLFELFKEVARFYVLVFVLALKKVWEALEPVRDIFVSIYEKIKTYLQPVIETLKLAWEKLGDAINWIRIHIFDPIYNFFKTFYDFINDKILVVLNTLKSAWDAIAGALEWVGGLFGGIKNALSGVNDELEKQVGGSSLLDFNQAWDDFMHQAPNIKRELTAIAREAGNVGSSLTPSAEIAYTYPSSPTISAPIGSTGGTIVRESIDKSTSHSTVIHHLEVKGIEDFRELLRSLGSETEILKITGG